MESEVSATQRAILTCVANEWNLEAFYTVEQEETTPERGAWCYARSSSIYTYNGGKVKVSPATFAALLRLGLVEEAKRYKWSDVKQGDRQWERWAIVYRLTEKGKTMVSEEVAQ